MKLMSHSILYIIVLYSCLAQSSPRTIISSSSVEPNSTSWKPPANVSWFTTDVPGVGPGAPSSPYALGMRYYGIGIQGRENLGTTQRPDWYYTWSFSLETTPYVTITASDTWGDLATRFAQKYGTSGQKIFTARTPGNLYAFDKMCAIAVTGSGITDWYYEDGSSKILVDNSSCGNIISTPTPTTCDIVGANTIPHGVLDVSEVNGHSSTINATVTCSDAATIGFRFINQSINMGQGITSQLKVNGSVTPAAVSIAKTTPMNVSISSTLQATNPTPGTFSGSSTIIIDVK